MGTIRVWTRQDRRILKVLEDENRYICQPEFIDMKMENFSPYYKTLYKWYVSKAVKKVPKPSDTILYPIWVSVDENMQLNNTAQTVILELEVDEDLVIVTDQEKWGYVVNFFYLPYNQADLEAHNKELKRFGIGDESALIHSDKGNFYPLLKQKIIKSWDRLFEDYTLSGVMQGTIWEIKKEWIINIKGN